jgi:hypothetical protein
MNIYSKEIERLEAESDCKISSGTRELIWEKIRKGIELTKQERLIHNYDLEVFKETGKWVE